MSIWSLWFFHGSSSLWWGCGTGLGILMRSHDVPKQKKKRKIMCLNSMNCQTATHLPPFNRVKALADISHSAQCCHSNETHAPTANVPNSAHMGPCSSVGMQWGTRQTLRHRQPWPLYISPLLYLTRNVTNWCHWTPKRLHKHSSSRAPILQTSTFMTA